MSAQPVCDRIITYNNRTAVIPGYEGIPQNLLINFVSWTVLLSPDEIHILGSLVFLFHFTQASMGLWSDSSNETEKKHVSSNSIKLMYAFLSAICTG